MNLFCQAQFGVKDGVCLILQSSFRTALNLQRIVNQQHTLYKRAIFFDIHIVKTTFQEKRKKRKNLLLTIITSQ